MFPSVCRVCLTGGVKMHLIENIGLQKIYEKFTKTKLHTNGMPRTICSVCRSQLQRCYGLYKKTQKAEYILTGILKKGRQDIEISAQILNQEMMQNLSISETVLMSLDDYEDSEPHLKEELDTTNDFFDDIDKTKAIQESEEIITEKKVNNDLSDGIKVSQDKFECHTCSLTFTKKSSIISHMKIHSENMYSCKGSGQKFQDEDLKANTEILCSKELFITCDKCQETISVKSEEHMKSYKKSYTCGCGRVFKRKMQPTKHMKAHKSENPQPHICTACKRGFTSKLWLKKHITSCCTDKSHRCDICNKVYTAKNNLKAHLATHSTNKYDCPECDKKFKCKRYLTRHVERHSGASYICDTCGVPFLTRKGLRQHTRIHNSVKTQICSVCSKAFLTSTHLRYHMLTHTRVKAFPCPDCPKSFHTKQTQVVHTRTHSGKKPFSCEPCNKYFVCKFSLQQHIMRLHTGIRPFACDTCQKGFPTKTNLRLHIRTHTGEKPYACKLCDRAFSSSNSLKRHYLLLHSDLKFACQICDLKFATDAKLKAHLKKPCKVFAV